MESSEQFGSESDRSTVIVDNCANAHICSEYDIFDYNIEPIISSGVSTIGVKDIISKGIVIVSWSWPDDEGLLHTNKFNNVLYFPESPINIISTTSLDESMKDYEVTWLLTKISYYIFTWDFGLYIKTISHS